MENQRQQPQNTLLCRANCGFYGSPTTENYCSKCFNFKDMIVSKQETGTGTSNNTEQHSGPISTTTGSDTDITTASPSDSFDDLAQQDSGKKTEDKKKVPRKRNRCQVCRKRVGLTGFECRCGGLYCGVHRYDTAHNCTFDYKTVGREELRKNNPQVIPEKIQRI